MTTIRGEILIDALKHTEGDRNQTYGDPHANLTAFAWLVEGYLRALGWSGPQPLDSTDGAVIMNQAKVSRISANKKHRDNYVDGSAYMAIAGECAEREREETIAMRIDGINMAAPHEVAEAYIDMEVNHGSV